MQASDGGLKSCFAAANVAPSLAQNIREKQECKTLRDFAKSFRKEDHVRLLDAIWEADEPTKAVRAHRGRLLSAWEAADAAIEKLENAPVKPDSASSMPTDLSWEAPLQEEDRNRIWTEWKNKYGVRLEAHVRPGDPLINRTYREFRMFQLSVTDVRKWKSVLHERTPDSLVETRMTSRSYLVEGVQTEFRADSVIQYYWGLRTLVNAWAVCGNYEVDSVDKPNSKVIMITADEALDYADRGLRLASRSTGNDSMQLEWWRKKDLLTRTLMANYVREKHPAGEALKAALRDSAGDWSIVKAGELQGEHDSVVENMVSAEPMAVYHPTWTDHSGGQGGGGASYGGLKQGGFSDRSERKRGKKGKQEGKGKGKKGGGKEGGKGGKVQGEIATKTRAGEKLCGAFNGKRGCKRDGCPQGAVHRCGVLTGNDGTVCYSSSHGAAQHTW